MKTLRLSLSSDRMKDYVSTIYGNGYEIVEILCSLCKPVKRVDAITDGLSWGGIRTFFGKANDEREISQNIRNQMIHISLNSFKHSRFFVDSKIDDDFARQTYIDRVEKFCNDDLVWYLEYDGILVGFVVFGCGEIQLIAVNEDYRRMSVGSRLVSACVQSCLDLGYKNLYVRTQGSNVDSLNFYWSQGFYFREFFGTFHNHRRS